MAKKVHGFGTPLDCEVSAFLCRIGEGGRPEMHVKGYAVERNNDNVHLITVQFIADEQFDAPAQVEDDDARPT